MRLWMIAKSSVLARSFSPASASESAKNDTSRFSDATCSAWISASISTKVWPDGCVFS